VFASGVRGLKRCVLPLLGEQDKPAKYTLMFHESKVLLINKTDLLPYVDCSVEKIREDSLKINPDLDIFEISCKTGKGLEAWYEWVKDAVRNKRSKKR